MNRRGFLKSILAAGLAPAICKAEHLMPVFVRRESGLLLPEARGSSVIKLFDALGRVLATIPMQAAPASMGRIDLSGQSPVIQTGVFDRATIDIPGMGAFELTGLTLNMNNLMMGNIMNMNVSLP